MDGVREPYQVELKGRNGKTYKRWRIEIVIGQYENGRPKRKVITSGLKTDCMKKAREYEKEVAKYGHALDNKTTLGTQAREWLDIKVSTVDPKTFSLYESIVNVHLKNELQNKINQYTHSRLQELINNMRACDHKGRPIGSAGTSLRKLMRTCLNQIFQLAVDSGRLERNPATRLNLGVSKDMIRREIENRRTAYTVNEMKAMLSTAARWDIPTGTRMWFKLLTGMRQGEVIGAVQSDLALHKITTSVPTEVMADKIVTIVDADGVEHSGTTKIRTTENREMQVVIGKYTVNWQLREIRRKHGCGTPYKGVFPCGKRYGGLCPHAEWIVPSGFNMIPLKGRLALCEPKSHTGRIVPIIPALANALQQYLIYAETIPNPHGLLFRHSDGSPIVDKEDTEDFKRLLVESGIDPRTHNGHETRHSVVTLLSSMNVDKRIIQEIVGHSDDKVTEIYRHINDAERSRAMEKLESGLNLREISWPGENPK